MKNYTCFWECGSMQKQHFDLFSNLIWYNPDDLTCRLYGDKHP